MHGYVMTVMYSLTKIVQRKITRQIGMNKHCINMHKSHRSRVWAMHHTFYIGDVMTVLKQLKSESIHCVVTSPPYFGLRDYGIKGQLGLEPVPDCLGWATGNPCGECYVCKLVEVFREVWRVLRKDGTVWLNLGDTYAASGRGGGGGSFQDKDVGSKISHINQRRKPAPGYKPKDLIGIPCRVSFALQADGWWRRSEITWCKKAPMPESAEDRPTNATEKIFLLTKSLNYYYDREAVREKTSGSYNGSSFTKGKTAAVKPNVGQGERIERPGRNMWNYWLLSPEPFPEAHFAVFPTEIPRRAILAGTSEKGCCPKCGAPWERMVEKTNETRTKKTGIGVDCYEGTKGRAGEVNVITIDWHPTCSCGIVEETVPCTVLDPFGGAGTTTLVAMQLGRSSIYIDLNPEYAEMAIRRCGFGNVLVDYHTYEVVDLSGLSSGPHCNTRPRHGGGNGAGEAGAAGV